MRQRAFVATWALPQTQSERTKLHLDEMGTTTQPRKGSKCVVESKAVRSSLKHMWVANFDKSNKGVFGKRWTEYGWR